MIAVYPGSFDPPTDGHLNIIHRAARLFEHVIVAVGYNPRKKTMFTPEQRVLMLRLATADLPNVEVESFTGMLLVEYARRKNAGVIVKGLRNSADFQNEFQQFNMNFRLSGGLDTIFLPADNGELFVSSTLVRDMIVRNSHELGLFVPKEVAMFVEQYRE
nr:pantetheine-phosphate adenylyltransferase [Ardenticatena sp.]